MKKPKFINIITFLFYLLFFILILNNSFKFLDPDFGWHLKVGEEIYLNQKVPNINHYNYIFSDSDNFWVDHEWLSNLLIFKAYNNFGYFTLNIIFALIFLLTIILLNRFIIKKISPNKLMIFPLFVIEVLGLKAMMSHSGVRIQEISWLFLLIILIILYYFENRALLDKKRYWLILIWLIPIIFLWTNLHASFLLGVAILFFYLGIKIIEKIIFNYPNKFTKPLIKFFNFNNVLNSKNLIILAIFSFLSTLTTLLTPYGLKLFDFLYVYGSSTAYLTKIVEWFSQFSYPFMYWQLLYISLAIAIWLLIFITHKNNKKILSPWNIALNLLFLILSLKSKRHFPFFFLVSLPTLIAFLYNDLKPLFEIKKINNKKIDIIIKSYLIITIIISITALILNLKIITNPFNSFCNEYPCQAVKFLKNKNIEYKDYNIFNNYNWGGYLIYTYPEKKLFIDGRLPQKRLKNHSYIEEYSSFYNLKEESLIEKIEEYDIKLFLLGKNKDIKLNYLDKTIFQLKESDFENNNKLTDFLKNNNNWKKVYEDEISIIYQKK